MGFDEGELDPDADGALDGVGEACAELLERADGVGEGAHLVRGQGLGAVGAERSGGEP